MREYCGETFSKLDRAGEGLSSRLFEDCLFTGCRLEGALVENCQFSGCRFEGCKITAPKFRATTTLARHMGWAYVRIRMEAPYLHGRTSSSITFMYFTTLGTKVTAQDKFRHPRCI